MKNSANNRFVLSGGPGAGKTTVLSSLEERGFHCLPDVARAIIRTRLDSGLPARPDPVEFARAIFDGDVENYRSAPSHRPCLFDRGVIDALGMLRHSEILSDDELTLNLRQYPYHKVVFVFPPWEEIYCTDNERDEDFAHSVRVYESVKTWYSRCGYEVQEIPPGPVSERADIVERSVLLASTH